MLNKRQQEIFNEITKNLGIKFDEKSEVEIKQTPSSVDSVVETHDIAVATMSAIGLAVATIGKMRGLGSQKITIDRRHAGLLLNSICYFFQSGWQCDIMSVHTAINGFYETKDGRHIVFNGTYPHLRTGLLNFFNCINIKENIAKEVKKYNADDLEQRLADAGLCATIVRSKEEWLSHPQGKILHEKPVIELIKIADGEPVPFSDDVLRPLEKIKIVDFTHVIASPNIGRMAAEHGADVINCRSPRLDHVLPFDIETSIGKKNAYIDIDDPHDRSLVMKLIEDADCFIQGFRYNSMEKKGFGYKDLLKMKKNIIYVENNCYGFEGPWAGRRGWEQLAESSSGLAMIHSQGRDGLHLIPALYHDYTTGWLGSLGLLAALLKRSTEGGSWLVRIALSKTSMLGTRYCQNTEKAVPIGEKDFKDYWVDQASPIGLLTRVGPCIELDKTPPYAEHVAGFPGSDTLDLGWGPYPIYPKPIPHRKTALFDLHDVHFIGDQKL